MKKTMMLMMLAVAGIAAADSDVDALKAVLENTDAETQVRIGNCFAEGKAFAKDRDEAMRWYRKAADEGCAEALYRIGKWHLDDNRITAKKGEAAKWYRKAAEMGLVAAQFNLGMCYDMGWGVEKDKEEALKWYRKASAQGCKLADDMINKLN